MRAHTCTEPFEQTGGLCPICRLSPSVQGMGKCSRMVAESEPMQALLSRVAPIAETQAPVVITGESGTGKEVLARALHANSPRKGKPFLAVNVAALPGELLESELFGHVRGAFTGAMSDHAGLFQAADGGTLLLDEIGEMPLVLQAKLLRVLQDGEVRKVGDTRPHAVDVRIICATHRDLKALIREGRFREDLYYRLKVFALEVPPLRERVADVMPLVKLFLDQEGHCLTPVSPAARRLFEHHPWPGNIRELKNAVVHAVTLSRGEEIHPEHLPEELTSPPPRANEKERESVRTLAEMERAYIESVLKICRGNQREAAKRLDIGRNTLWRKLRTFEES